MSQYCKRIQSECFALVMRNEAEDRAKKAEAEVERLRAENEELKMWRDSDPYCRAGKRAAQTAIDAWEQDCIIKDAKKVEPEKAWEDVEIVPDGDVDRFIEADGCAVYHTLAPSLRGFMGYVYDHPNLCGIRAEPVALDYDLGGQEYCVFPVAVRFAK